MIYRQFITRAGLFVMVMFLVAAYGTALGASAAQATERFHTFPVQARVIADLPSPVVGIVTGGSTGHATLVARNTHPTAAAVAAVRVHWVSLTTGRSGLAFFGAGTPVPVAINPGTGPIAVLTMGGLNVFGAIPGGGTAYVS